MGGAATDFMLLAMAALQAASIPQHESRGFLSSNRSYTEGVLSAETMSYVIPAKAGNHVFGLFFKMDASFRWHDGAPFLVLRNFNQVRKILFLK